MMPLKNIVTRSASPSCSIPSLFISLSLLCILPLSLFFFFHSSPNPQMNLLQTTPPNSIKVYVADLPTSLNYGLLENYWALDSDSRIGSEVDNEIRKKTHIGGKRSKKFLPYPENPIIKQYSAEYWILGDLMTPEKLKLGSSFAKRVFSADEADVIFVPFFATLSAEMQLIVNKGVFRKKKPGNQDYQRQRMVVDFLKQTDAWKRSGGRDHVFVITDPVAMWHVKDEVAPAILLVVDFGGWYKLDSNTANETSSDMIHHTQVSLLKDVIVPYTHLLPRLPLSENQKRETLIYFKGAKHRHRGGIVREKLWDLLINEPRVVMEEGFPNATGREQSIKGMRTSEFCLHPAGDTPTSCRLFDAVQSLCIPVIVSDNIELPFEGMVDYSEFSVFVAVSDALQPSLLVNHLRSYSNDQKDRFRRNMALVQPIFEYENGQPGGIGPVSPNGAINYIWRKVHQKLPMIKETIIREKRKPLGALVPLRCHCT
ncbi:putative arabinosyltransferase ARAD1 [Capsicum galapagoense]